jgi:hypothetical protein
MKIRDIIVETALRDKEDLDAKRKTLQDMDREPGHDREAIRQAKLDLEKQAREKGLAEEGLWANIHAKRERIKNASGERMRKPGSKGAPTAKNFKDAASEGVAEGPIKEFAPSGGGGSGDYFRELASAWYNGTYNTGSLQKGIKSQEDVERLLQRGVVAPDGKTRKYGIDYNSDFDGVVISSDDYYEHSDYNDKGQEVDSRTGKPWGPYDYMEFKDEELDESADQGVAEGIETIFGRKYAVDPNKYYVWAWDSAAVIYGEYDNIKDAKINLPKIEQRAIERLGSFVKGRFELSTGKDLLQRYGKKEVNELKQGVAEGKLKCSCHPGDADPDCPVHGLEPMEVGDALDESIIEESYDGDEFYEAYGDLWYDEEMLNEAEYQGRKVQLGKPMRGDVKKFKVYVKDPSTGNIKKVNFGDPNMKIRKSNPKARKSFRARHNCDNPGPRTKARYWSCRKW